MSLPLRLIIGSDNTVRSLKEEGLLGVTTLMKLELNHIRQ